MTESPLLSVLVPTKNRSECAKHTIAMLLGFESNDFEVIVHDNSDDRSLADWVDSQPNDPRLRYLRTTEDLSISQNFEQAVEAAAGRYVGALGDDDGLSFCVLEICRWLEENDIDALSPSTPALYLWPGITSDAQGNKSNGLLTIKPFTREVRLIDPEAGLQRIARTGARRLEGLPKLYHGIVRRRCLQAVHEQTGRWLPGVSPDMAAAVSLASHVNQICELDYPVFVPGASPNSGAGRGVKKTHQGDFENEPFLDQEFLAAWPVGVPRFFSGPTMWAAGAVQALQATGRHDLVEEFNYPSVHAACLAYAPTMRYRTMRNAFKSAFSFGVVSSLGWHGRFAGETLAVATRRLRSLARRNMGEAETFAGIPHIGRAVEAVGTVVEPLDLEASRSPAVAA